MSSRPIRVSGVWTGSVGVRTWGGQLDVLVCIIQRGAYERRHGTVHHKEVFVAVGLCACHSAHQCACIGHHGPPWLNDDRQAQRLHCPTHSIYEVAGGRNALSPTSPAQAHGWTCSPRQEVLSDRALEMILARRSMQAAGNVEPDAAPADQKK